MQYKLNSNSDYVHYFVEKEDDINYIYNCYWLIKKEISESWYSTNPEFKELISEDARFVIAMPYTFHNPSQTDDEFYERQEKFRNFFREFKSKESIEVVEGNENDHLVKNCSFEQIKEIINSDEFQRLRREYTIGMFAVYLYSPQNLEDL